MVAVIYAIFNRREDDEICLQLIVKKRFLSGSLRQVLAMTLTIVLLHYLFIHFFTKFNFLVFNSSSSSLSLIGFRKKVPY